MAKFVRTRKVLTSASAGLAVAAAFANVALLLVQLVKTVSDDKTLMAPETGDADAEKKTIE